MGDLDGVRVLDLSIWRPGPYATQLLAERGADVIKVEPPGGDPMRTYPELFAGLNALKRSVELDLKDGEGRAGVYELAAGADVFIEGFRPGVAARLGVHYDAIKARNAAIVYCSLSGFGQTGPLVDVPAHDLNYLAWAGALAPDGGPPRVPAVAVADLAGGMAAAFGICAALLRRHRTGEGTYIDLAMADVVATWTGAADTATADRDAPRQTPGYGLFAAADGYLALSVLTEDHLWRAVCERLGLADLAPLSFTERLARVDEMQARIGAATATQKRDELLNALLQAGAPAAPVLDRAGMLEVEQFKVRGVPTRDASGPALDAHRGATWR